jgi:2-oxoglutarate dehydrogenase E1 component
MPGEQRPTNVVGPNAWLVDEMYEQYLADPNTVSESWREFFADYRPGGDHPPATAAGTNTPLAASGVPVNEAPSRPVAPAAATITAPAKAPARPGGDGTPPGGEPLRGVAARIVANMEASLGVPTATSFREVPAKLLEVNRSVINGYLGRTGRGKVSFTHLIGFAVVRAVAQTVPVMNNHYAAGADGKPYVVKPEHVGLGIAVDVAKADGSRSLLVPVVRNADTLDFRGFWTAYEDLIRKVRSNKLSPDDFAGITISLTNPGTIGTVQSVPTTTASSRAPSRGCSSSASTSC